jgi:lysozyme
VIDLALMKAELKRDESVRLKPYRDTVGKLTIGVGRNLDDVGITAHEADFLLTGDIANAIHDLDMALPWWGNLSEVRQRALLNMCFNLGIHRLLGFRNMLEALRKGEYVEASNQALNSKWAQQVGSRAQRIAVQFVTG